MARASVFECFENDTKQDLNLSRRQVSQAFALCKMTIPNETENMSLYDEITFVEFLELLGRLAVIKFEGSPQIKTWSLLDRLETIIDAILRLVGAKATKVEFKDLQATESDDDY